MNDDCHMHSVQDPARKPYRNLRRAGRAGGALLLVAASGAVGYHLEYQLGANSAKTGAIVSAAGLEGQSVPFKQKARVIYGDFHWSMAQGRIASKVACHSSDLDTPHSNLMCWHPSYDEVAGTLLEADYFLRRLDYLKGRVDAGTATRAERNDYEFMRTVDKSSVQRTLAAAAVDLVPADGGAEVWDDLRNLSRAGAWPLTTLLNTDEGDVVRIIAAERLENARSERDGQVSTNATPKGPSPTALVRERHMPAFPQAGDDSEPALAFAPAA